MILTLSRQNPRIGGDYQGLLFFDGMVMPPFITAYELKVTNRRYVLEAGWAHGILDGAKFTIYKDRESVPDWPSGYMIAREEKIRPFSAELSARGPRLEQDHGTFLAVLTDPGTSEDLRIHIPMEAGSIPAFEAVTKEMDGGSGSGSRRLRLVIHVWEKCARSHGLTQVPYEIADTVKAIHHFIRAASHFYVQWNLNRSNPDVENGTDIEFYAF